MMSRSAGADAPARLQDAGSFEMAVDLGYGVGVDAKRDGELPDGRQLIAGLEAARGDGDADAAFDLRMQRHRVSPVYGAGPLPVDRHGSEPIVLVQ